MIRVKLSEITKKVEEGSSLSELSELFHLSKNQMSSLLKEANLKVSKKGYQLINDTQEVATEASGVFSKEGYLLIEEPQLF